MKHLLHLLFFVICCHTSLAQAWYAGHNLSEAQYQAVYDKLTPQGYVPFEIDAINDNGQVKFSGVWRQEQGIVWEAKHNLSEQEYQNKFNELVLQGYVVYSISVYKDALLQTRFAAIWKKEPHTDARASHNLSEIEFQRQFDELIPQGYFPYSIAVYNDYGTTKFAIAWRKEANVSIIARHNLNEQQYQQVFDEYSSQGYVPIEIATYTRNGETNFAAVWKIQSGIWWRANHNLTSADYQLKFAELNKQGYRPYIISTYKNNAQINYAVAWQLDQQQKRLPITVSESTPVIRDYTEPAISKVLTIAAVKQQTQVWCWLACGEMICKHYGISSANSNNYQCGIIGKISGPNSPCYSNCFSCQIPSGSNYGTLRMISNYAELVADKSFTFSESKQASFEFVRRNIDNNMPILCGTSYNRRQYYSDAEHVVLIVGYKIKNGVPYLIVNDPFPYANNQNPYLNHGAQLLTDYQYEISYRAFKDDIFWHWTISNISFN